MTVGTWADRAHIGTYVPASCRTDRRFGAPHVALGRRHSVRRVLPSSSVVPSRVTGAADTASAGRAVGHPIPHHLVRAHFKTYTCEAPLFGKRVGPGFWGWQARGEKRHGVRAQEYDVRPT